MENHRRWQRERRAKNPERARELQRAGYLRNREVRLARQKAYYEQHRDERTAYAQTHLAEARARDRARWASDDLKVWLRVQFQPGMCWENYGQKGWHIDHVLPLASFDLTDRAQFLVANNWKNLQPLWAEDNLRKGDTA